MMPGQSRAPPLVQKCEPVIEKVRRAIDAIGVDKASRKFDGEWDPVQLSANPRNDGRIGITEPGPPSAHRHPFSKKLGCRKFEYVVEG